MKSTDINALLPELHAIADGLSGGGQKNLLSAIDALETLHSENLALKTVKAKLETKIAKLEAQIAQSQIPSKPSDEKPSIDSQPPVFTKEALDGL